METLLRPMERAEQRLFVLCLVVSTVGHLLVAWAALPGGGNADGSETTAHLAERFARAVNAVTDLDPRQRAQAEELLGGVSPRGWTRPEMGDTIQWLAEDLDVPVADCDVVRSLDPERSREGRWDIRAWVRWEPGRAADDLLTLAFVVGEGTLKSDFGSHRFWIHLEAADGAGRVAFETMDCRLYRAGKLAAADLLHRASWLERREPI